MMKLVLSSFPTSIITYIAPVGAAALRRETQESFSVALVMLFQGAFSACRLRFVCNMWSEMEVFADLVFLAASA
ncbi:hypothetical protein B0H12DRAFT_1142334 [Mycena haematopus]|nr:hypothetical protein B0H12DRAFT_1142334 [Mycena haematopus]